MHALFSPDSRFMQAMGRIGDLLLLNFVFLLSCVPLFTIGAASAALYTVCFRIGTPREQGVVGSFFRAFRENFRQGTALWLILLFCGGTACLNILAFAGMSGPLRYAALVFAILLALVLLMAGYAFPLLSRFRNSTRGTFRNALILSLGYLPRSILIAAINAFPFALLLLEPYLFFSTGFVWIAVYFSAAGYINSLLLKKVFAPYTADEEGSQ